MGLLLIAASAILINEHSVTPGWWALLPTTGAALLISAGPQAWLNRRLLGNSWLTGIGLISYPLYLWHWPLLSYLRIYEGGTPSLQLRLLAVELSFVLAWLTYLAVETPLRSTAGPARKKVTVLCVAMLLVSLTGLHAYLGDGLGSRTIRSNPDFMYDYEAGYRYRHCFIDRNADPSEFDAYCSGRPSDARRGSPSKPLVMVWGDSHAASLYPGLQNLASTGAAFTLAQYTASGCPPLLSDLGPGQVNCNTINRHVADKIEALRPDTVILSSYWLRCSCSAEDYAKLKQTIRRLQALKVKQIILFGQLPKFERSQPLIAKQEFVAGRTDRTYRDFDHASIQMNATLKRLAAESNITFVSPTDLLCNAAGCLISSSRQLLSPMAWDYGHLTGKGSILLIDLAFKDSGDGLVPR